MKVYFKFDSNAKITSEASIEVPEGTEDVDEFIREHEELWQDIEHKSIEETERFQHYR